MAKKSIQMDSPEELAAYRVKRLERQAVLMQKMTTRPTDSGLDALFRNYAALLTVSALICHAAKLLPIDIDKPGENGKKEPLGESVQRQFFQPDQLKIIDLIAYAHTHEPTIIRCKKKFDIFSSYAAAGFDYLSEQLDAEHRDWSRSEDVMECGKILAQWYLKGSKGLSVTSGLSEL